MTLDRGAGMEFRTHRPSFSRETEASKEHSPQSEIICRGAPWQGCAHGLRDEPIEDAGAAPSSTAAASQ